MGVGEAVTVMLSEDAKAKPVVSHARITMACFPAGSEKMAVSDALVLLAFCAESIYMIIAVTVCSLSRAPAENVTGELTVAPLAGEQIFTVLSTVAVQAAHTRPAISKGIMRNRTTIERARENIRLAPTEIASSGQIVSSIKGFALENFGVHSSAGTPAFLED